MDLLQNHPMVTSVAHRAGPHNDPIVKFAIDPLAIAAIAATSDCRPGLLNVREEVPGWNWAALVGLGVGCILRRILLTG